MGCASSKILTRSASYQEELNQKFSRSYTGLDEVLASSNGGDQLFFLLSAAKSVSKRIKSATLSEETETKIEIPGSKPIITEKLEVPQDHSVEQRNVNTFSAWELLAGLDENEELKENSRQLSLKKSKSARVEDSKHTTNNDLEAILTRKKGVAHTRSFHTVEDYDAFLASIEFSNENHRKMSETSTPREVDKVPEQSVISLREQIVKTSVKKDIIHTELEPIKNGLKLFSGAENGSKSGHKLARNTSTKRMEMAKELQPLAVPSSFDFAKSGSLMGWLLPGGQLTSPGSYVTPKFGSYAITTEQKRSGDAQVFDPEMVAQFEEALHQLKTDEESAFKQIIESIEEDGSACSRA